MTLTKDKLYTMSLMLLQMLCMDISCSWP